MDYIFYKKLAQISIKNFQKKVITKKPNVESKLLYFGNQY